MRIKILLASAAALALGLASSNAQVYSANIVGYVTVPVNSGFTMVANQMDLDGTGTNNSIYTAVGTNLPSGTLVEYWSGSSFLSSKLSGTGKWSVNNAGVSNAMNPGVGFFVSSAAATNFITVGNVIQGTNNYSYAGNTFSVVSPNAPLTGGIHTTFGLNPSKGDIVEVWSGSSFLSHKWSGTAFGGGEPTFSIGQSMFLDTASGTNNTWTQTFTAP